jgi:hypothetical protein
MIEELYSICDLESDDNKVGWRKRRDAIEGWLSKYLNSVETSMSVVNPQVFDSEFMDFIKESLAKKLAEDLTTSTKYDITDRRITAKMVVLNGNSK